ncbi:MAG TPA: hypothetical protein VIN08_04045, partial [Ohtaekwangia sp.]|uniref:hypothetical protein n=1 Tax=Ohtaekwangia sp. TaxID=2066019 RepID=UPI002F923307
METLSKNRLRKIMKKAAIALQDSYGCNGIGEQYLQALRTGNIEAILWFNAFGPTVRHQLMNAVAYQKGLKFGFEAITLDKHGWLANAIWKNREEIEFRLKEDSPCGICNSICLAEGNNTKWAYGISAVYGTGSGYGSPITVFNKPYDSRQQCIEAALTELKKDLAAKIVIATCRPDP